jgi:hypothetical protein
MNVPILYLAAILIIGGTVLFLRIKGSREILRNLQIAKEKVFQKQAKVRNYLSSNQNLFYSPKVIENMEQLRIENKKVEDILNNWNVFFKKEVEEAIKAEEKKTGKPVYISSFALFNQKLTTKLKYEMISFKIHMYLVENFFSFYPFVKMRIEFLDLVLDYLKEEGAFQHLAKKTKLAKRSKERVELFLECLNIESITATYQHQFAI